MSLISSQKISVFCLLIFFLSILVTFQTVQAKEISALYVRIEGSINPAQKDLLQNALNSCQKDNHQLLIIGLDTPGGLGETMRTMVKMILNSPVPVITWVGPRGAHAASAGVFLVAASHVAAMSPQTNIGAASPVAMGGKDIPETMAQKIKNDFLSLIRGMAESRNRNVDWYEKSIEEAASITATKAVEDKVVDFLAESPEELLIQVGKKGIKLDQQEIKFSAQEFQIVTYQPGLRYSFLSWLLHPQIAYFLLLGGVAGLFFELSNPGSIFPGVFGGICLLLGLYAMSILPTNVAGLLLIFLSLVLFILEIAVTSFGLLSIAALVSLFTGSLILFKFEYGFANLPIKVILPTVCTVGAFMALGLYLVTKAQLRPQQTGSKSMIGLEGEVLQWDKARGKVKIRGEIWTAQTEDEQAISPGTKIQVKDIQGLNLIVETKTDR